MKAEQASEPTQEQIKRLKRSATSGAFPLLSADVDRIVEGRKAAAQPEEESR